MPIEQEVYKRQRLVLVRFRRAARGNPDAARPDIDDRGYADAAHGPIVGITQGETITLRLERQKIEDPAGLFVSSSDTSIVTVESPAGGTLPNTQEMDIQLRGVSGGSSTPNTAQIRVHFGSATGVVIHQLTAWVYAPVRLAITPHVVTIAQTGGGAAAVGCAANVAQIMRLVRAIWAPCGITFTVRASVPENVTFAQAGVVSDNPWPGEVNTLLSTNHAANTINVYFAHAIRASAPGSVTLGYGISRQSAATHGFARPGILLAEDGPAGGIARTTLWWANDLAHEIGHFLRLWHPNRQEPPSARQDSWSRRMLMHNFNRMNQAGNWRDDTGYGTRMRGCMITMKNLSTIRDDAECGTARSAARAGPY